LPGWKLMSDLDNTILLLSVQSNLIHRFQKATRYYWHCGTHLSLQRSSALPSLSLVSSPHRCFRSASLATYWLKAKETPTKVARSDAACAQPGRTGNTRSRCASPLWIEGNSKEF
jgi:hypothetical protein